jgi:hypothetical protein
MPVKNTRNNIIKSNACLPENERKTIRVMPHTKATTAGAKNERERIKAFRASDARCKHKKYAVEKHGGARQ